MPLASNAAVLAGDEERLVRRAPSQPAFADQLPSKSIFLPFPFPPEVLFLGGKEIQRYGNGV